MHHAFVSRALRALAAGLLALFAGAAIAAGYTAQGGRIHDPSGQEIQLRGISHFGFNAPILQPQFLWAMGWKQQIAQIKSLGFNAVRVPFVPDTLYNTTPVDRLSYVDPALNPELIGKTPLQALDLWMAEADRQGLYLLLDFHSVSKQRQYPTWFVSNPADFGLVYNQQAYTKAHWLRDLAFVARRYAHLPRFFAIDVFNEPNGKVRWSTGDASMTDPAYFWKAAVESAAATVLAANPNLMIFVQGIAGNFDGVKNSRVPMNWGEDFQPQAYQPLAIPLDKLVLSPHTYGPDVFVKSSFSAPNFPANLAADWELLFGRFVGLHPVVPGEWGGRFGNGSGGAQDTRWQNAFVDWMIAKGMRSSFYWCYTPNSGDTGGILDDNLAVRQDKMTLLRRLWAAAPASPAAPAAYAQQRIAGFAPASGGPGTVLTVSGSGFTGTTRASLGQARNIAVTVLSDAQLRFTVPAGATTGQIALSNPVHTAFSATAFNVLGGAAAPAISQFAPLSGPVGTQVTVQGSGFTGATVAWVGQAKNAPVRVVDDGRVVVTVPAGATTGAIGIFTPRGVAFTARSFDVGAAAAAGVAPYIVNFSPAAGPVGTVVTINGSGFTGASTAWIGAARNATVRVLSDSQVQVTVPAGATSGAIGVFNPAGVSFTASAFTVN